MEQISYKQAAELLGMAYITIREATGRGVLTKCASNSYGALFLKEQVALFKDKGRLSKRALSIEELEQWEHYKKIAEGPALNVQITREQVEDALDTRLYTLKESVKDVPGGILDSYFSKLIRPSFMSAKERGHL